MYDVGRRESFEAIESVWLKEVDLYSTYPNAVKLVVGNKIDQEAREVTLEEGLAFAREHGAIYIDCSAKTKVNLHTPAPKTPTPHASMVMSCSHPSVRALLVPFLRF